MKWFVLWLASASGTIVKVIQCKCNKMEESIQSILDMMDGKYLAHSVIYNQMSGTCDAVITFESPPPTPSPFLQKYIYVPP